MLYQCRRYAKAVNRMDYRLLMDTSILAGEIIMENGGEAYRAEETVNRMLNTSKAKHVEVVVMGTSMVATVSNPMSSVTSWLPTSMTFIPQEFIGTKALNNCRGRN